MSRTPRFCDRCGTSLVEAERFGRTRPFCITCERTIFEDPKVAVVVFVVEGDSVLLVKRLHDPGKGGWALPAGFVDADEDPRLAAVRETQEETGLQVEIVALLDVLHRPDPDGLADIIIAYRGHVIGGTLTAADDAEDAAWFPRDALPSLALVTTRRLVEGWLGGGIG